MLAPFVKPQETIMRYKITQRGVYDAKGEMLAIGSEVTASDDAAWLTGKAEALPEPEPEDAVMVTNPKKA